MKNTEREKIYINDRENSDFSDYTEFDDDISEDLCCPCFFLYYFFILKSSRVCMI